MSKSTNLEGKESFDPINYYDGSYPLYPSFNNEEQIDSSYPLYIPQDGEFNSVFGIFSELPQIRTDATIVQ